MATLLSLSQELQTRVASFLLDSTDLLSLSKTCQALHETASERLYHRITLHETDRLETILAMLSPDNVGLKHIRVLCLRLDPDFSQKGTHGLRPVDQLLHALAYQLPRNTLRSFFVEGYGNLPVNVMTTFHQRQRLLQTIRVDNNTGECHNFSVHTGKRIHVPSTNLVDRLGLVDTSTITTLQLYISSAPSVVYSYKVLAACPHVRSLDIDFEGYMAYGHDRAGAIEADIMTEASSSILEYIFGHCVMPKAWNKPGFRVLDADHTQRLGTMSLTSLRICGLDLRLAATVMLRAIRPELLQSLDCYNCWDATALLVPQQANQQPLLTHLKSLTILSPPRQDYRTNNEVIDTYLRSTTGLEALTISAYVARRSMPDVDAFATHAATLRWLYVDMCHTTGYLRWAHAALSQLCAKCEHLTEFALDVPGITFLEGVPGADPYWPEWWQEYMEILLQLPKLTTLLILNLPTADRLEHPLSETTPNAHYVETKLREIAASAFKMLRSLSVVGIGRAVQYDSWVGEIEVPSKYFVRDERTRLGGHKHIGAEEMSKHCLQAIEPDSGMLDVDPERDCLPLRMCH